MFSVSPEIYEVLSVASRWIFAFFALMLLVFALVWHHAERKERKERFKNLPGAGTVGELIVLSGSDQLAEGTWFPVPREGVLGSLRSCDLVIPCPGVSSQHLDFSWQDGSGLLIRPRVGCEVLIDGVPCHAADGHTGQAAAARLRAAGGYCRAPPTAVRGPFSYQPYIYPARSLPGTGDRLWRAAGPATGAVSCRGNAALGCSAHAGAGPAGTPGVC